MYAYRTLNNNLTLWLTCFKMCVHVEETTYASIYLFISINAEFIQIICTWNISWYQIYTKTTLELHVVIASILLLEILSTCFNKFWLSITDIIETFLHFNCNVLIPEIENKN